MNSKLYGSLVVVVVLVAAMAYKGNYISYYSCMSQTKSDYITEKGAAHVAAQCRSFILDKAMTN